MKTLNWTLSLIAGVILLSGSASAQCTRHFYNNSNFTFKVGILTGLCNNTAICTIRPHSTGTLVYFPLPGGTINISSRIAGGTFGISGWVVIVSLFYAPLTEEPAKWLTAAVPAVRGAIMVRPVPMALAVGAGFGIGEIWFLARALAMSPDLPDAPFWMFNGFMIERLVLLTPRRSYARAHAGDQEKAAPTG